MKFRKLRITFSTLCAILWLSLVVLWVQSYTGYVYLAKRLTTSIVSLQTDRGELSIWSASPQLWHSESPDATWAFDFRRSAGNRTVPLITDNEPALEFLGFRYQSIPPFGSVLFVPFWAMLLPVAAAGALPWIKWRIGWRSAISTVCVLTTVLLIGVWIRSHKWMDITDRSSAINVCSMNGQLFVGETFMSWAATR